MPNLIVLNENFLALGTLDGVDVMIADPPYREHVHRAATSCGTGGLGGPRGVRSRELGFTHLSPELRAAIARQAAVIAKWSLIYSDIESLHEWRLECVAAGASYIRAIPWIRWSQPQLSGDRPPTGCEMISVFYGRATGKKTWNGPGNLVAWRHEDIPNLDFVEHKSLRGDGKHKAEKPLDQALDLVSYFSQPGELVLDPVCGSGTVGVACALLDRNFIGVEMDPVWAEFASRRIAGVSLLNLSERDLERVGRWIETTKNSVDGVREPRSEAEQPAWERVQRRVKDLMRVENIFGNYPSKK